MASAAVSVSVAPISPTPEELVARAHAMIPVLKARAKECIANRDVSEQTIVEMKAAGFFKILQPKRWGGYEMHPNVFFEVQKALAEGCMSTGWMYGVVGCHPYELALFHNEAQEEVWASDSDMLVSSTYQPVGKVTRVEGGFRLSGHWGFSTGSVHCGWVLLGAVVPPENPGDPFDMRTFLLPRSDYAIDEDAWHVFGLQGTGSHDIIVDGPFGQNPVLMAVLAQLRAGQKLHASDLRDGTTAGAACLGLIDDGKLPRIGLKLIEVPPAAIPGLKAYQALWRQKAYAQRS